MGAQCCGGLLPIEIPLNQINNIDDYLIALSKYSLHAQSKLGISGENSENSETSDNNILTYEQYQYYISLNSLLFKVKMLMEDYLINQENQKENMENDIIKEEKNYKNNNIKDKSNEKLNEKVDENYDFTNKKFNLKNGIYILESIMDTEDNFNSQKLENIENKIYNQMFIRYN